MKINKIKPYFKDKRKYRTVIFAVLPIASVLFSSVAIIFEIDFLCSIFFYTAFPLYVFMIVVVFILLNIFGVNIEIDDHMGTANTITNVLFGAAPFLLNVALFLLFLLYCRYYRTKRIKAYKSITKFLKVTWIIIGIICVLVNVRAL